MQEQQTAATPLALQALEVLNESQAHVYAMTYNPITKKYMMLRLQRERVRVIMDEGASIPAQFSAMLFSAGNTPEDAARDALKLHLAPERTVDSSY